MYEMEISSFFLTVAIRLLAKQLKSPSGKKYDNQKAIRGVHQHDANSLRMAEANVVGILLEG